MSVGSPCSESSTEGTAAKGARSESAEMVRWRGFRVLDGWEATGALGTKVDEVGSGVGRTCFSFSSPCLSGDACIRRFAGRGRTGEDDCDGSNVNGGSSEGAGRFFPMICEVGEELGCVGEPMLTAAWCGSSTTREQTGVLILRTAAGYLAQDMV